MKPLQQSRRLKNKIAWIIGGKRVGQVVAQTLAEEGVHLIVSYRKSEQEANAIAQSARKAGVKSLVIQMDASQYPSVKNAVAHVLKKFPRIDILINMSSVFMPKAVD